MHKHLMNGSGKRKHRRNICYNKSLHCKLIWQQRREVTELPAMVFVRSAVLKNGEFNIHSLFFNSLKTVNPTIKNAAMVAEIIAYQIAIVKEFKNINKQNLNSNEVAYIGSVFSNVIAESLKDIDALTELITDNRLQMSDDERIERITRLYTGMQEKYMFSQLFAGNVNILSAQKQEQLHDAFITKQLYNLK